MPRQENGPTTGAEQFRAPRAEVNGARPAADALPVAGQTKELFFAGGSTAAKLEAARIQTEAAGSQRMARRTRTARR